ALAAAVVRLPQFSSSSTWRRVISLAMLAASFCDVGDLEGAAATLDAVSEDQRDYLLAPELRRLRGEIFMRAGQDSEAERWLRDAAAMARARSEKLFELRATTSLAG